MNTIRLFFGEDDIADTVDSTGAVFDIPKYDYEVLTPIFKNGKTYLKGETISLDENTAQGFIQLNEIRRNNEQD